MDFYHEHGYKQFIAQKESTFLLDQYTSALKHQITYELSKTEDINFSLPIMAFDPLVAFNFMLGSADQT